MNNPNYCISTQFLNSLSATKHSQFSAIDIASNFTSILLPPSTIAFLTLTMSSFSSCGGHASATIVISLLPLHKTCLQPPTVNVHSTQGVSAASVLANLHRRRHRRSKRFNIPPFPLPPHHKMPHPSRLQASHITRTYSGGRAL